MSLKRSRGNIHTILYIIYIYMYTHTYVYNHRFGMIHGCHEHEFMEVKNATSHVLLIIALRPGIVQVIQVGVPMFFAIPTW